MTDERVERSLRQRTHPRRITPPYAETARGMEAEGLAESGVAVGVARAVMVTKDGGNPGGIASECTYTYTVKDYTDTDTLATGVTPERPRLHFCAYWYAGETRDAPATATSRRGMAHYDEGGTLILVHVPGEIGKESA